MFHWIRLYFQTFTPVETRLLSEVEALLPDKIRATFALQLKKINHVQRILDWVEVNFYCTRYGKVSWDPSCAFSNKTEFTIARITFEIDDLRFKSELKAVNGHVFALMTRPSIKRHWYKSITRITTIKVEKASFDDMPAIASDLPLSYLDWISQANRDNHGWDILAPEKTYIIALSDADYRILAIRDGEYLMSRAGISDSLIFHVEEIGAKAPAIGRVFSEAVSL